MIICLSGFMGCGKSTVGRELQKILSWRLTDLDSYIEQREGRSIKEIFSDCGEASFRAMELSALQEILTSADAQAKGAGLSSCLPSDGGRAETTGRKGTGLIISLGGGTLTTPECEKLVREHTTVFYLSASVDTLVSNLFGNASGRPLLASASCGTSLPQCTNNAVSCTDNGDSEEVRMLRARIKGLMAERSDIYQRSAHHTIITDGKSPSAIAAEIASLL